MEKLSQRLRRFRLENELTLKDVAKQLDVSVSTYRDWEYGKAIQGEPYVKLAEVFNVSLSELLMGVSKPGGDLVKVLLEIKKNVDEAIKSAKALS